MTEITLELASRDGTLRIMTLRADGTYNVRYVGDPPNKVRHHWHRALRDAYLVAKNVAHLVPLIDAAFEALRAEADDPET